MAYTIPTHEPAEAFVGESWFWDVTYGAFPADESWQLAYYLRGPKDLDFAFGSEVTAGDGSEFEVRVPATTTDDLAGYPGPYRLIGRVSKSGEVHTVYNEHLLVLPDPATAVNAKSHARQMLDAIEAALLDFAAGAQQVRTTVNGRTVEFRSTDDLTALESRYRMLVALEDNPDGSITRLTEFVRA